MSAAVIRRVVPRTVLRTMRVLFFVFVPVHLALRHWQDALDAVAYAVLMGYMLSDFDGKIAP